ncbi:MAG: cytochrome c4 [Limnohabitans sp.]|jgi:cytochrome c553|nr:cytochrome c4 [Limnohabitans sp.]
MSFKPLFLLAGLIAGLTAPVTHAQDLKGDPQAGEKKIAMCIGCHGIPDYKASFPEVYRVPMISGQGAKYITNALNAYKSGERKHPTMRSVALGLTDQDMADISAYYENHGKGAAAPEQLPPPPPKVAELLTKGGCAGCHGPNYSKPVSPDFPKVAGQHRDYLFIALKSYKAENTPTWGRNNAIMAGVAKQYTNAELKLIANYLGTQPGELKVVPQSRFR